METKQNKKTPMTFWEKIFLGIIVGLLILYIIAQSPKDEKLNNCIDEYNKLADFTMNKCYCEGYTPRQFYDFEVLNNETIEIS